MPTIRAPASKQTATLQVRVRRSPVHRSSSCKIPFPPLLNCRFFVWGSDSNHALQLQVAVKCRPLTDAEQQRSRHIIQVIDDKVWASGFVDARVCFAIRGRNVMVYMRFSPRLWLCWTPTCQRITWTSYRTGPRRGDTPSIMCTRLGAPIRYVRV
jgi:hypothetical protein